MRTHMTAFSDSGNFSTDISSRFQHAGVSLPSDGTTADRDGAFEVPSLSSDDSSEQTSPTFPALSTRKFSCPNCCESAFEPGATSTTGGTNDTIDANLPCNGN
mmetsp:Transcript_9612/g.14071  ORF Transcript_9612/g.14071 Transcript_9612/m.14071 type:complete len:103 (-) Transcript_9612:5755-6063(-)